MFDDDQRENLADWDGRLIRSGHVTASGLAAAEEAAEELGSALRGAAHDYGRPLALGYSEGLARGLLASDWLAKHDAAVRAQALAPVRALTEPYVGGPGYRHYAVAIDGCVHLAVLLDDLRAAVGVSTA